MTDQVRHVRYHFLYRLLDVTAQVTYRRQRFTEATHAMLQQFTDFRFVFTAYFCGVEDPAAVCRHGYKEHIGITFTGAIQMQRLPENVLRYVRA